MNKEVLYLIAGPTASGKSAAAVQLAQAVGGEIISGDSMQVYRHMDIGTAKITPQEMEGVPHHLIDVIEPWEEWNVALFVQQARTCIEAIRSRGHVPIVCGGTGFYLHALAYGSDFAQEETNSEVRRRLEVQAETEEGRKALYEKLQACDRRSADAIHPNNLKRVIRALEYYQNTGKSMAELNEEQHRKESPFDLHYLVLDRPRDLLYERIDRRVLLMMEQGLVDEVRSLLEMGCRREMVSMQGLGYKEIIAALAGETDMEEAVRILQRDTRHFAKRQLTWYRREKDAVWVQPQELLQKVCSGAI